MYPAMFTEAFMGATAVKILACLIFVLVFLTENKVEKYVFLGGTTLKILAALAFIFIFRAKNHVDKAVFLGDFMYIYLLNTVFEVYILLRTLRHKILR